MVTEADSDCSSDVPACCLRLEGVRTFCTGACGVTRSCGSAGSGGSVSASFPPDLTGSSVMPSYLGDVNGASTSMGSGSGWVAAWREERVLVGGQSGGVYCVP